MLAIRWCAPIHVFRTTTLRPAEPTPRRAKAPTQTQSRLAPQPRYSWPGLNFNTPITPMSHTVSGWVVGVGGGSGCSIGLGLFLGGWVLGVGGGGWGRRLYYWLRLNLARHACRPMYDVRHDHPQHRASHTLCPTATRAGSTCGWYIVPVTYYPLLGVMRHDLTV